MAPWDQDPRDDLVEAARRRVMGSPMAVEKDEAGSHNVVALVVPIETATDLLLALARVEGLEVS